MANTDVDDLVGKHFNFTQFERLVEEANGDVRWLLADNISETFALVDPGPPPQYSSDDNTSAAILTRAGTGANDEFTLAGSGGVVTKFFGFDGAVTTPGRIKSRADRFGNTLTYTWQLVNGVDQLASVTDGYGREIVYRYYDAGAGTGAANHLREIEDFLGRKLNFQYDDGGRLIAVVTPSINRAAEGNEFPDGTAYVFRYASSGTSSSSSSSSSSSGTGGSADNLTNIWYPNQATAFIVPGTRTVDVEALYQAADSGSPAAAPRYTVEYDAQDRVVNETVGNLAAGIGGTYSFDYSGPDLPKSNLIDPSDAIVAETVMTDRNGNEMAYFFNANQLVVCEEIRTNRNKIEVGGTTTPATYVTWTKYNAQNQVLQSILPEGNSIECEYDDGMIDFGSGAELYVRRRGLLNRITRKPGNVGNINSPTRGGSGPVGGVQEELTTRYFYEPIFNHVCATIEERGNPINDVDDYFPPQNGGTTPTDADRSRYATITIYDYQQNTTDTVKDDATIQSLLFPEDSAGTAASKIQSLVEHVDAQMTATDGTGGIPTGFQMDLGDINGDGTGDGASSGLPAAPNLGSVVMVQHPEVRQLVPNTGEGDPWMWQQQERIELFTVNLLGQTTTHTDPEGNVTAYVRYPYNDPDGDGQSIAFGQTAKQYGRMREVHVDVDPADVMSLVGSDGDLEDFIVTGISPRDSRTNTPGVYQDLTTRYEGSTSGSGCAACAYDQLGNPLAQTDARGFTSVYERNELGQVYRSIAPKPYEYKVETYFDANGNVVRTDTEDKVVQFNSDDPANAGYAHFTPEMNQTAPGVAHIPTKAGSGGTMRSGWFTNLFFFDILDNVTEQDIDATGSTPASLVTTYSYDANQNLIQITKPEGNIVEYDYEERDLRIAQRVGRDASVGEDGAITISFYDRNGNLVDVIGPADRGTTSDTELTATIEDAFGSGSQLVHTGDCLVESIYDGFDRNIQVVDAVGNVSLNTHDPGSRVIAMTVQGPVGGATPTDRNGTSNVDLASSETRFDEAGRAYEQQQDVFLGSGTTLPSSRAVTHTGGGLEANATTNGHTSTVTLTSAGESYVLTRTVFDRASRSIIQAQDNTGQSATKYDGANRAIEATDAAGNVMQYAYDGNSNVIESTSIQKCTITEPQVADESFTSRTFYDALNRVVAQASQGADGTISNDPTDTQTLFTFIGYDSRSNATLSIDPKSNTKLTIYDGASRATELHEHLRQLGEGDNPPVANNTFLGASGGTIRTITRYDGNSRVLELVDDRGAPTTYQYDTLDRQTVMTFIDGSTRTNEYNAASNVITYTDENGSEFDGIFDPIGRRTAVAITPASGIAGTTAQSFQYDGLSRTTFARDSVNGTNADVTMVYDSLSRVLEDSQVFDSNTRNATNSAFGSYPVTEFTYPQNRQTVNEHDLLYRRTSVGDSGSPGGIAEWEFFGPSRVAEVVLGNGLICTMMNNDRTRSAIQDGQSIPAWGDDSSDRLGYDGAGRMITKRFLAGGINGETGAYDDPTSVVGFTTEFDRSSNKSYERHLHAESRSHLYQPFDNGAPQGGYDSIDRLRQYQRGVLSSTGGDGPSGGGGSVTTPISLPNTDESRTYDLDSLGNWKKTQFMPVGGSDTTQRRDHNYLNEITRTVDGASKTDFVYDGQEGASNGNLADDGTRLYEYDALNRLLVVKKKSGNATIGTYTYDAMGRRIRKVVSNGGLSGTIPNGTIDFLYTGWRCAEERDGSNDPAKQYVWGIYIDELIQQREF